MAAAAFFYAAAIELRWQLLIVVASLFFGTLCFFTVLFDESSGELTEPLIIATVQEGNDDSESVSSLDFFHLKCLVACAAAYSSQGCTTHRYPRGLPP